MVVALLVVAGSSYSRAESDEEGDYEELRSSHSEGDSGKSDKKNVNVKSKEQSKGNTIAQESKMKKFNSSSVWTERKCERCKGTGSVPTAIYDNKKNSVTKIMLACPKCKGRGYECMTKDN
jgi:Zn finger protein HypA/HybF involved in hydrogenase expression